MDRRIEPHLRFAYIFHNEFSFHLLRIHQFLCRLNPRSRPRRRPIQRMSLLYRPLLFRPRLNLFRLRLKLLRLHLNLFRLHRLVLQLTKTGSNLKFICDKNCRASAGGDPRDAQSSDDEGQEFNDASSVSSSISSRLFFVPFGTVIGRRQNRTWRSECRRASMRNNFTASPNFPSEAHRRPRMSSQRKPFVSLPLKTLFLGLRALYPNQQMVAGCPICQLQPLFNATIRFSSKNSSTVFYYSFNAK